MESRPFFALWTLPPKRREQALLSASLKPPGHESGDMPQEDRRVRVNPLGTLLRELLGPSGSAFILRPLFFSQVGTLAALLAAWRHQFAFLAACIVVADVLLLSMLFRNRDHLGEWRDRVWSYSERSRWL